jgi:fructose-bisphosphate aldolase class II
MAMVDMKDLLYHAYQNRYAVGAFEIVNLDFLKAVIEAAEQSRSPVILNVVEAHIKLFDFELLMAAVVRAAKRARVPVAIYLDHCSSLDAVQTAISLGCNGVMYDSAEESFPVNVENTRQAVNLAHACGVPVEGEVGYVAGIMSDDTEPGEDASVYTSVNEAKVYVERTGVDFLGISIGTVHGRAKNKLRLDFNRLARIHDSVNIPLVIHGGTGLNDDQYHKLIDHGVAKINYFTALAEQAIKQIKANVAHGEMTYEKLFANVSDQICAEVQRCMQIWGSAGRAAEVLMQCRAWNNVEHVIVYNTRSDDPDVIDDMLNRGKQDLSKIPGVLQVQIGKSVNAQSKYRYCWLIRFAHEQVIESYKSHPIHVAYADKHFRPLAEDRITTDYEIIDAIEVRQWAPLPLN